MTMAASVQIVGSVCGTRDRGRIRSKRSTNPNISRRTTGKQQPQIEKRKQNK